MEYKAACSPRFAGRGGFTRCQRALGAVGQRAPSKVRGAGCRPIQGITRSFGLLQGLCCRLGWGRVILPSGHAGGSDRWSPSRHAARHLAAASGSCRIQSVISLVIRATSFTDWHKSVHQQWTEIRRGKWSEAVAGNRTCGLVTGEAYEPVSVGRVVSAVRCEPDSRRLHR